jgi:O-antigen/teichoic acid export membrane protein
MSDTTKMANRAEVAEAVSELPIGVHSGSESDSSNSLSLPELMSESLAQKLIRWSTKSGLAILDQGLISGSNFVVSILLARWLTPEQYGAYAVAFGVFILLSLIYMALLLEPMAVFGSSTYQNCLREYFRLLVRLQVGVALLIITPLGIAALVAWKLAPASGLPGALAGVTLASPCLFLFWLARRAYYLELSPARAVRGAFLYFCIVLGGLGLVYHENLLSPFSAFLLIALGSLVTSGLMLSHLQQALPSSGASSLVTREIWQKHWAYGRWALATAVASWIPTYIYYPMLSSFNGMGHSGELRALMNFANPIEQTQIALAMLFLPYAARVQGADRLRKSSLELSLRLTLVSVGVTAAYWGMVILFRTQLFQVLYSGKYLEVAPLLRTVAIGSLFWSAAYGSAIVLRAMESPASIFVAYITAAVASLLVGVVASRFFGVVGAVWGINISDAVSFLMVVVLLRRKVTLSALHTETPAYAESAT